MLKILFDTSSESDKLHKAADNLVVLSRDEAGAERIFREGGPTALVELLEQNDPYVRLSAIRTLSALCNGHQARVSVKQWAVMFNASKTCAVLDALLQGH